MLRGKVMGGSFWQVTKDSGLQGDDLVHEPQPPVSTQDVTNNILVSVINLLWILSPAGPEGNEPHAESFLFKEVFVADFVANFFQCR